MFFVFNPELPALIVEVPMKRLVLTLAATLFAYPAFAQSTITLDDLEPDKNTTEAAQQGSTVQQLEQCLLGQTGCKNSKFKSSTKFSR